MDKQIHTEQFPELHVDFDRAIGVVEQTGNAQQARIRFAQALRARGYKPAANGTWIKPGCAAVMVP